MDNILITTAQDDGHSSKTKYNLISWGTVEMRIRNFTAQCGNKCWTLCIMYIYCILDKQGASWDLHLVVFKFESLSDHQASSLISSWFPSVCYKTFGSMYRTEANCLPHPFKSVIHYNITQLYTKCGPCLSNASRKLISEIWKKVRKFHWQLFYHHSYKIPFRNTYY